MLGNDRDKKLVERPEDEPPYNKNSKTDRRLVSMFVLIAGVLLLLGVAAILIYVFLF